MLLKSINRSHRRWCCETTPISLKVTLAFEVKKTEGQLNIFVFDVNAKGNVRILFFEKILFVNSSCELKLFIERWKVECERFCFQIYVWWIPTNFRQHETNRGTYFVLFLG